MALILLGVLAVGQASAAELTLAPPPARPDVEAETRRAFIQEREANVVVLYEKAKEIRIQRPDLKQTFGSEAALLSYLAERKEAKKLLVVIFSKNHEFSNPKQTIEGFWQACRYVGFERVVIQQARGFGRSTLHE